HALPTRRSSDLITASCVRRLSLVMRTTALILAVLLTIATHAIAQSTTSSVPYSTPDRGGTIIETAGGSDRIMVGYGRVQPSSGTTPSGVAIFGFRQNGVLVTEAGVPGMTPI